jgi:tripartite-type tricarboxylate transporter receptor subunit TctC
MTAGISRIAGTLIVVAFAGGIAQAQQTGYPNKAVRFIVPFPAGGPTDVLGRVIGQKLAEQLGQPVVLDNRSGAGGNLGIELAAKSPPDGYTLVLGAPPLAISPHLYAKLNYDPIRDFAPVSLVASMPTVLLVHPSVPVKTLKELVQLARANPGKLNFGSGGAGTSNHLASELLKDIARINLVHVPYKGASQAMLGLLGGQVDMVVIGTPTAVPQIQAGKVRALAVLSDRRLPAIGNVPTAAEAGFPGYEVATWYGVLAPAGTSRDIVGRLNAELARVVTAPASRERLIGAGFDPLTGTPEQFGEFIKAETARWGKVIRDAGIKAE